VAWARWQVAWVTSPASHLPDLAGIPTTCPNSLLPSKSNAQLLAAACVAYHGEVGKFVRAPRGLKNLRAFCKAGLHQLQLNTLMTIAEADLCSRSV
jgi:hypothetical protein